MDATEIVERIQSAHWDFAACQCWICRAARDAGLRPRKGYVMDIRQYPVAPMDGTEWHGRGTTSDKEEVRA